MGWTAFPPAHPAHSVPALLKKLTLFCSKAATPSMLTEHALLRQKSRGEQIKRVPLTAVTTSDRHWQPTLLYGLQRAREANGNLGMLTYTSWSASVKKQVQNTNQVHRASSWWGDDKKKKQKTNQNTSLSQIFLMLLS